MNIDGISKQRQKIGFRAIVFRKKLTDRGKREREQSIEENKKREGFRSLDRRNS